MSKGQTKAGVNISTIRLDGGVNRYNNVFDLRPNEAIESYNCSLHTPGVLSYRFPIEICTQVPSGGGSTTDLEVTTPYGMIAINNTTVRSIIYIKDGGYINVYQANRPYAFVKTAAIATTLNTKTHFIFFATTSNKYVLECCSLGVRAIDIAANTASTISSAPATNLYTTDDNRVYALKNNILYWSAINTMDNWTTGDSGNKKMPDMSNFNTAITAYNDMVICFSSNSMHILYGDDINNYQFIKYANIGCKNQYSICNHEGSLYWVDNKQLYRWDGAGKPSIACLKIGDIIKLGYDTTIASKDDFVYISYKKNDATLGTIKYNPKTDTFTILQEYYDFLTTIYDYDGVGSNVTEFLMGITANDNNSYNAVLPEIEIINQNATYISTFDWTYTLGFRFGDFNKFALAKIPILYRVASDSVIKLYVISDVDAMTKTKIWESPTATATTTIQTFIDLPPNVLNDVNYYSLHLEGTGDFHIYAFGEDVRIKER